MQTKRGIAGVVAGVVVAAVVAIGGWVWLGGRSAAEPSGFDIRVNPSVSTDPLATTAGDRYGWGEVIGGSEFTDAATLESGGWEIFTGAGYQGEGRQRRDAVAVTDGVLRITGDAEGNTGAVGYYGAVQQYGRWEARIRIPAGDGAYHPVALLWPSSENWPDDGEIDYVETTGSGDVNNFSIHHGADKPEVTEIPIDREWHTYAVEWTPTTITAFYDGRPYFQTTDTALFPEGPMWHSFQLDWMGEAGQVDTVMEIDWLRVYRAA